MGYVVVYMGSEFYHGRGNPLRLPRLCIWVMLLYIWVPNFITVGAQSFTVAPVVYMGCVVVYMGSEFYHGRGNPLRLPRLCIWVMLLYIWVPNFITVGAQSFTVAPVVYMGCVVNSIESFIHSKPGQPQGIAPTCARNNVFIQNLGNRKGLPLRVPGIMSFLQNLGNRKGLPLRVLGIMSFIQNLGNRKGLPLRVLGIMYSFKTGATARDCPYVC
jgi:hypothetical protein